MTNADFLKDLGALSLGSRLRRMSEELVRQVEVVYQLKRIEFSPRMFPAVNFLSRQEAQIPISVLAEALGVSHPAMVQTVELMKSNGLIDVETSTADQRQKLLSLSKSGKELVKKLRPVWAELQIQLSNLLDTCAPQLLTGLSAMETKLKEHSLAERVTGINTGNDDGIVEWSSAYSGSFRDLNLHWIEKNFGLIEEQDKIQLNSPEKSILKGKGMIFFAKSEGAVVGTCALIQHGDEFELCKMAVSPLAQGQGIATRLLVRAIEYCRRHRARRITLESNRKLKTALGIYRKAGFKEVPVESKYARVDIGMELRLG